MPLTCTLPISAQWAVTTPDSGKTVLCIGDINRMTSQYKRGGGTVCFNHATLWATFNKAISGTNSCSSAALRGAVPNAS